MQQTAAAVADQASHFSRLPEALLVRILQALPQHERLTSCAAVCTSWAAAATAATVDVDLSRASDKVIAAFQPWLQQHARQIVSLKMSGRYLWRNCPQLQLPCPELVSLSRLEVEGQGLRLDGLATSGTAAAAGSMRLRSGMRLRPDPPQPRPGPQPQLLPKLQQLKLATCNLINVEALLQLIVLTSLTSLQLNRISVNNSDQQAQAQQGRVFSNALCTLLAQLPQLVDVELSFEQLAGSSLSGIVQQLSSLRQLRSADIHVPEKAARMDDVLSALPRGLTGLTVRDEQGMHTWKREPFHPATFPQQMPQLSDLQELQLQKAVFHPGVLSVMKRLQRLKVDSCILLPRRPSVVEGAAAADAAASAAASAFLAALGGMTDLVSLAISDAWNSYEPRGWEAAPAAAFKALTASSKLQELVVQAEDELPLPWGAVQHAFPAGRVLPHLTQLILEGTSSCGEPVKRRGGRSGFMSAQHLRAVVGACPALVELQISNACASHDLTPLLQLPSSVTWLSLGGSALGDDSAATVAQLIQLKMLFWDCSFDLTDAGLEHLTALRRLTYLNMTWSAGLSSAVTSHSATDDEGGMCEVTLHCDQAEKELLCDRLEKSPQLWGDRLVKAWWQQQVTDLQQQLGQTRAEARQQSVLLQQSDQRAAEAQQQVTELQQQLAELRQQVAQMQQQTATAGRRRRA